MELTLEEIVLISQIALGLAGAGITASAVLGIKHHRLSQVEPKLEQALDLKMLEVYTREEPKKRNYYNVRCPCGRFAKRLSGSDSVVICAKHEVVVDWKNIDIDWLWKPISTTEYGIDVEFSTSESKLELAPITEPIFLIPDYVDEIDFGSTRINRKEVILLTPQ